MRRNNLAFLLFVLLLTGCKESLFSGLPESRAQKIFLVLSQSGIEVEREVDSENTWVLRVNSSDVQRAISILTNRHLLPFRAAEDRATLNMLSTKSERMRLERIELANEIEQTLLKIPGILDARLHLSLVSSVNSSGKGDELAQRPCGSLIIFSDSNLKLDEREIRSFIAGAAGIDEFCLNYVNNEIEGPELEQLSLTSLNHRASKESFVSSGLVSSYKLPAIGLCCLILGALALFRRSKQ